jgi:hypothetical protein
MEDEPTTGVTSARNNTEAPPAQETDDRPDDTVRITARMPRSLRDDVEYVVDAGRFTDMSEAIRYAIRDTFGDAREPLVVTDGGYGDCEKCNTRLTDENTGPVAPELCTDCEDELVGATYTGP